MWTGGSMGMDDTTRPALLGALLKEHHLAAGLTQEALAERAGVSTRGIQMLERDAHRPHQDTLERVVAALGLGVEERAPA